VACRSLLQSLLTKIREKQTHIENAKSLIDRRHTEITQKERAVANEVQYFGPSSYVVKSCACNCDVSLCENSVIWHRKQLHFVL